MITQRGLDATGDWLFGKGQQDYASGNAAIALSIQTRLNSFLGDCFFAVDDGLDWFNLLGINNQLAIQLAVSACILNTNGVTGIQQLALALNRVNRSISITYSVTTIYSGQQPVIGTIFNFIAAGYLLTQGGDRIQTQSGVDITV